MWLYFNSNGQLTTILEHGSPARVGTTNFEIFAVFENITNIDQLRNYSATIKLKKPDLTGTEYPTLLMNLSISVFHKNSTETDIGDFEDNKTYYGFLFDFGSFDIDLGEEQVVLLDTDGLWQATINLIKDNLFVQGVATFNVGGTASETETDVSYTTVTNQLVYDINQRALRTQVMIVVETTDNVDADDYEVGQTFLQTSDGVVKEIAEADGQKYFQEVTRLLITDYTTTDTYQIITGWKDLTNGIKVGNIVLNASDDTISAAQKIYTNYLGASLLDSNLDANQKDITNINWLVSAWNDLTNINTQLLHSTSGDENISGDAYLGYNYFNLSAEDGAFGITFSSGEGAKVNLYGNGYIVGCDSVNTNKISVHNSYIWTNYEEYDEDTQQWVGQAHVYYFPDFVYDADTSPYATIHQGQVVVPKTDANTLITKGSIATINGQSLTNGGNIVVNVTQTGLTKHNIWIRLQGESLWDLHYFIEILDNNSSAYTSPTALNRLIDSFSAKAELYRNDFALSGEQTKIRYLVLKYYYSGSGDTVVLTIADDSLTISTLTIVEIQDTISTY